MSASTRSSARERGCSPSRGWRVTAFAWLALAAMTSASASATPAPPLPAPVESLVPGLRAQGGGEMRVFGLAVYDGWYWAGSTDYSIARPFALDLRYARALDGARIAERSVDEIEKLGFGTPEQRSRWGEAMRSIFPSVVKGDRLTGVNLPERGVAFFHNGRAIGDVPDPAFARAFFGIWLDPRTSRPDFRRRLLGES